MKTTQSSGTRPVHQTVAGGFNFKGGGKAITVEFTDQRLSPHAGSATFWGWLHPSGWIKTLAAARKKLVGAPLGEYSQSVSQLQCSRKSTCVQRLNHGNK